MTKDKFLKKYQESIEKECNGKIDSEHCVEILKQNKYPDGIWEYNQIIGYIVISADADSKDILFGVYTHIGKIYALSCMPKKVQNLHCTGLHIRYENLSKEELINRIRIIIDFIENKYFKGRYLDLEIFNNIIDVIDFNVLFGGICNG